jgi:hypothetical protein
MVEGTAIQCTGTGLEPVDLDAAAGRMPKGTPPALLRHGTRVRLIEQVAHCGAGCEGTVTAIIATTDRGHRVQVDVAGFGLLVCPPSALERIKEG